MTTLARNVDWDRCARYYDAYVRTDVDVPFLVRQAKAAGGPVLELMCGTGRITVPLAEAAHDVTALDSSAALLARLREKLAARALAVQVVEGDARAFELARRFAMVFVGFHAFAELLGRSDRERALRAMAAHLAPGGRIVLTLHNPPVRAAAVHCEWRSMGTFPLDAGSVVEVSSRWDLDRARGRVSGVQRYRELDGRGGCRAEVSLPIVFDLVAPAEVADLARGAGLEIVETFGDYAGAPFDPERSPFFVAVMRASGADPAVSSGGGPRS